MTAPRSKQEQADTQKTDLALPDSEEKASPFKTIQCSEIKLLPLNTLQVIIIHYIGHNCLGARSYHGRGYQTDRHVPPTSEEGVIDSVGKTQTWLMNK